MTSIKLIDSPAAIGRRIKTARTLAGLSRQDLENQFNISSHTLQSWELGRNPLTNKGALRLIRALEKVNISCSAEWLLDGSGLGPRVHFHSDNTNALPLDAESTIQADIKSFYDNNKNATVILVSNDAMLPLYKKGDYVGGCRVDDNQIKNYSGHDCIIQIDEGIFLRRFICREDGYTLSAINPKTNCSTPIIYCETVLSISPIFWHRSKLSPIKHI